MKKDGAALRELREMAGLGLEEVQGLFPISMSRLSRVERNRIQLLPDEREGLERVLSAEIRRRAHQLNEYVRAYDCEAVSV
jgi:transcriptional regulator with XRE-family HTH domain